MIPVAAPRSRPTRGATSVGRLATVLATAVIALAILGVAPVTAADPSPGGSVDPAGDPRVPSGGPSLIGEPGLAIALVIAVGGGAAAATLLYVRLTAGRHDRR